MEVAEVIKLLEVSGMPVQIGVWIVLFVWITKSHAKERKIWADMANDWVTRFESLTTKK